MNKINCALLVDDDETVNLVNRKLIERLKITKEIKVTVNGFEALNFITDFDQKNSACPELIFLDINMPIMDGYEFLSAFQNHQFKNKMQVVIVLLSNTSNVGDINRADYPGVKEFMNKPLTEEKIKAVTDKYFGK